MAHRPWNPDRRTGRSIVSPRNPARFSRGKFRAVPSGNVSSLQTATQYEIRTDWKPTVNSAVYDLSVAGNRLYLAGGFSEVESVPRWGSAAYDFPSGTPFPTGIPTNVSFGNGPYTLRFR